MAGWLAGWLDATTCHDVDHRAPLRCCRGNHCSHDADQCGENARGGDEKYANVGKPITGRAAKLCKRQFVQSGSAQYLCKQGKWTKVSQGEGDENRGMTDRTLVFVADTGPNPNRVGKAQPLPPHLFVPLTNFEDTAMATCSAGFIPTENATAVQVKCDFGFAERPIILACHQIQMLPGHAAAIRGNICGHCRVLLRSSSVGCALPGWTCTKWISSNPAVAPKGRYGDNRADCHNHTAADRCQRVCIGPNSGRHVWYTCDLSGQWILQQGQELPQQTGTQ